uniref:Uncharacterized protein n=1 Tax=Spongospora subterranea TaxID=70186 RepID=A0A0H5RBR5_9EUKA|eukprot:CRZ11670.1 hypothetical protein [Spongospora subterranea]
MALSPEHSFNEQEEDNVKPTGDRSKDEHHSDKIMNEETSEKTGVVSNEHLMVNDAAALVRRNEKGMNVDKLERQNEKVLIEDKLNHQPVEILNAQQPEFEKRVTMIEVEPRNMKVLVTERLGHKKEDETVHDPVAWQVFETN